MKKITLILIIFILSTNLIHAQFVNGKEPKINKNTNLILGFINPNNFSMKHSVNVSMMSSGFGNIAVTSYINSMNYKISDKMNISADVTLQYAPYANSVFGKDYSNRLQNDFSGITLSKLAFDYKISDDMFLKFEYRNLKGSYYDDPYNPYYRNSFFGYDNSYYGR